MKPMVLADIAQAVEMHESTISRVTTQKYLHSPRGILSSNISFPATSIPKAEAKPLPPRFARW